MYIPLSFWFCRNPGLALPLIALQYHEVRLNFIFRQATDLVTSTYDDGNIGTVVGTWPGGIPQAAQFLPKLKDAAVYIDYIYLDTDERRRFAQQSHEYLIDQLQYGLQQSITSQTVRLDLTLNHPVKELVWVFQDARKLDCSLPATSTGAALTYTQPFSYDDIANRCRIQLNGQDRFDERYGDYFWKVQPYQHHSGGGFESGRTTITLGGTTTAALSTAAPTSLGAMTVVFTLTANPSATGLYNNTATQTYINIAAGGAGVSDIQGAVTAYGAPIPWTVVSSADVGTTPTTRVKTGAIMTFGTVSATANATTGTWSNIATGSGTGPSVSGGIYTANDVTVVAVWDPNQSYRDNVTGTTVTGSASVSGNLGVQVINPINMYSFSLAPEEHQPSGSCNFSRIDTTTLVFDSITTGPSATGQSAALAAGLFPSKNFPYLFRMYAVNYNIFRVMSGMGGLAYSN